MVNYREILRLDAMGYSKRQIAATVHSSRNTVTEALSGTKHLGLEWPLDESYTNESIRKSLYPEKKNSKPEKKSIDFQYIHKELAKQGVNLSLLWTEYCSDARDCGENPYMYTQFCDLYRNWAKVSQATMRINHKPGDAMQVDWAGNTLTYYDSVTGAAYDAYVFVAVLPCSCYAYVEACEDMTQTNWISCHVHAYEYFQGSTRLLIPDNLKTGVQKNTLYETILNRSYAEMAEHYDTAIVPCRVRHPKDKSLAEGTVKFVSTWIIAALRNEKFFSIEDVKEACKKKLEELNNIPFKKRPGCRRTAYFLEEQEFMKPLPSVRFETAIWTACHVGKDYLVTDGLNKYSVPYDLIGSDVYVKATQNMIEVFYHDSRVAIHNRAHKILRDPVVKKEHMPEKHRKYLNYNTSGFIQWAESIGAFTTTTVRYFLSSEKEPEQGYKSCVTLIKLGERYGNERLENACKFMASLSDKPTERNISLILKNGQDKITPYKKTSRDESAKSHGFTRGASYYKEGGDMND